MAHRFSLRRLLIGRPLRTSQLVHQRLSKVKALAVFSSDALSSVAYATEEILLVLVTAGTAYLGWSLPITLAIIGLLIILTISYRQTIHSYPSGGGAYIVARENLGTAPGLVAGAALLIDYVLTVAVSISAGVAAITSAFPELLPHRVALALIVIAFITIANLRGVRESATIFAVPTYLFIFGILTLIATGIFRYITGTLPSATASLSPSSFLPGGLSLFLLLRAFSSGCTALTGVEAISNGVPAFKEPEAKNASITLVWMATILATLFAGISFLAYVLKITPVHGQTVLSQIAGRVFGRNLFYYYIQASTAMILFLAANTSYADFPRLASLLARDGFLPRILAIRGDRLVFSNGIIALGTMASLLVVLFHGETHRLIPLYAVGVFLSFTLSQSGMVRHWVKLRHRGWRSHALINLTGAVATGIATVIIAALKFTHGAWMVILLIPTLVTVFRAIHRHYEESAAELAPTTTTYRRLKPIIIIPVATLNKVTVNAIEYAKSLSDNIRAVHISIDPEATAKLKQEWDKWNFGVELLVIPSPYRAVLLPLIRYIERVHSKAGPDEQVTVLIPEFVTKRWWHYFLHNQTGLWIRTLLLLREDRDIVVTVVPYHLKH